MIARGMGGSPTIQVGSVMQKLVSALGIHGKVASPTLGDLVHPVVIIEDISRDSWYAGGAERIAGGAAESQGAALQFAALQLLNPVGSLAVAFVDSVSIRTAVTSAFWIDGGTAQLASAVAASTRFRDTRSSGTPVMTIRSESLAALTTTGPFQTGNAGSNTTILIPTDYILQPGDAITVKMVVVAGLLGVAFKWRERPL